MLVLMTLTHLPSRLTTATGQPFGFVSAAEGFVILSAFMTGMVYGRRALRDGFASMRHQFWDRTWRVYVYHVLLLLFLLWVITPIGVARHELAVTNLSSYYLEHPRIALVAGLALIYEPALLDILPFYVVYMVISPWLVEHGLKKGWHLVLAASFVLWLLSQFGLGAKTYALVQALTGLSVPYRQTGSFDMLAWQFLWVLGLSMGTSRSRPDAAPMSLPSWLSWGCLAIAAYFMAWRHYTGQAAFGGDVQLNMLFDKWVIGPLRLLNVLVLIVVIIRFGPGLAHKLPRMRWLETMGQASLHVFCAHLVIVLTVLVFFGADAWARPWWLDVLILLAAFLALYGAARLSLWHKQRGKTPGGPGGGATPSTRSAGR